MKGYDTSVASADRFLASYQRKIDDRNAKRWGYSCASRMCLEHTVLTFITPYPETAKAIYNAVLDQYGDISESYFLTILRSLREGRRPLVAKVILDGAARYKRTPRGTLKLRRMGLLA